MTLADLSYWPESGPDQAVYVQKMLKKLGRAKSAIKPTVVAKFTEPTQDDWEAAWANKFGMLPPIYPGAKLLWYDLSCGEMKMYSTVFNLRNGTDYDGTVFPVTPSIETASPYRFLGSLSKRGTMLSSFSKPDNTITTMMLNPEIWTQRGLQALHIEFALDVTPGSLMVLMRESASEYVDDYQRYDLSVASPEEMLFGCTVVTVNHPSYTLLTQQESAPYFGEDYALRLTGAIPASTTELPFIGFIHIDVPTASYDVDTRERWYGQLSYLRGYSFGNGDSANLTEHIGLASRQIVQPPSRTSVFLTTHSTGVNPTQGPDEDQAWVYGLFSEPQEQDLKEF